MKLRLLILLGWSVIRAFGEDGSNVELSPKAREILNRDGFVVVDDSVRQGFSAYINADHPVFVTSDSLLLAWHRIHEEILKDDECERLGARWLVVWRMWEEVSGLSLPKDDEVVANGIKRARLIVATCFRLLVGRNPDGLSAGEAALVDLEVERVEKCEGAAPPEWLGNHESPPPYLPYSIFKPGIWCEGVPALERYYRFCKWLQEMPIPSADPANQSMAVCFLWMDNDFRPKSTGVIRPGFSPRTQLYPGNFEAGLFEKIAEKTKEKEILAWIAGRKTFRLLGAVSLAEEEATRELLEMNRTEWLPEFVGASLENPVAKTHLSKELLKFPRDIPWPEVSNGFPADALRCLNLPADKRAPRLFGSDSWRRKQLNTTLGSWTECRHAMGLVAKESIHYWGDTMDSPGFVEPYPSFFSEMAKQGASVAAIRENQSATRGRGAKLVLWLDECIKGIDLSDKFKPLDGNLFERRSGIGKLVEQHALINEVFPPEAPDEQLVSEHFVRGGDDLFLLARRIRDFTNSYWAGNRDSLARADEWMKYWKDPIGGRLRQFTELSESMAKLAEKQLSKEPWSKADKELLTGYGIRLGRLMFYEGNSYLSPKDDASKLVRYATLGSEDGTRIFHAGVGRPRLLFIRYPDPSGNSVLCQGAVYSFRKFEAPATPSGREWRDAESKQVWPEWMQPILASPVVSKEAVEP